MINVTIPKLDHMYLILIYSLVVNKSLSNFLIISVNTCNITVPKLDAKCIHSSKQLSYAWKVGDFKLDDKLLQYLQRSLLLFRTWIINMYAIFMNSHHIHGKIYLSSIRFFVICTLAIINVTIPKLEHLKAFF